MDFLFILRRLISACYSFYRFFHFVSHSEGESSYPLIQWHKNKTESILPSTSDLHNCNFHSYIRCWKLSPFSSKQPWIIFAWFVQSLTDNVKLKLFLCLTKHHAMKTYWGSGDIVPRILDFGTRWMWLVNFMPRGTVDILFQSQKTNSCSTGHHD
jgi:hypothetical protein